MAWPRQTVKTFLGWCRRMNWVKDLDKKCVFITGCDSGFGYALAKSLSGYGIPVFAGCYTATAANWLKQEAGSNLRPITVDVTKSDSVRRAANYVKDTLPKDKQLWGVVNNAGILGQTLPTEMLTKDDFREVYEVNVFGIVDVTNAFLPLLKQSGGRIVNMASIGGIVPFPNWTPYISSKHAAKGYSDSLRLEKEAWGIKVSTIQPGFMKTDLFSARAMDDKAKTRWKNVSADLKTEYGEDYMQKSQLWTHRLLERKASTQVNQVIRAYEHALFSKRPRAVYYPGFSAKYILAIQTLPTVIWDQYLLRILTVFPKATGK